MCISVGLETVELLSYLAVRQLWLSRWGIYSLTVVAVIASESLVPFEYNCLQGVSHCVTTGFGHFKLLTHGEAFWGVVFRPEPSVNCYLIVTYIIKYHAYELQHCTKLYL